MTTALRHIIRFFDPRRDDEVLNAGGFLPLPSVRLLFLVCGIVVAIVEIFDLG